MGMFIRLEIDMTRCIGSKKCGKCINVCPVDIFCSETDKINANPDNEDECILCNLCVENCPVDAITISKLYEKVLAKNGS